MRFDDSLSTVLAAETRSAFGAQSAFRQIVDLVARGRVEPGATLIARLAALRPQVPVAVRAASARGLALARPPLPLVEFFASDEPAVASAMLRIAMLDDGQWEALIPRIGPHGRSVLRDRRDLSAPVLRALDSFGSTDFTIGFRGRVTPTGRVPDPPEPEAETVPPQEVVALSVAPSEPPPHGFPIAELVSRIAAFQSERPLPDPPASIAASFRLETDPRGRIAWTDAEPRGAVLGLAPPVIAAAALAKRPLRAARLTIDHGPLSGDWRIDGEPQFDADGRYAGLAVKARRIESVAAVAASGEAIRRLVHELRTPLNAISGFAELIAAELFGPVVSAHRTAAGAIHIETAGLLAAIEDLDLAARVEADALNLTPGDVAIWPLLTGAIEPHGGRIALHGDRDAMIVADEATLRRLLSRFVDVIAGAGEPAVLEVAFDGQWNSIAVARPRCWGDGRAQVLAGGQAEEEAVAGPLLGTGFTLRLIADLARVLGGTFDERERLTLRLPRRFNREVRIGGRG